VARDGDSVNTPKCLLQSSVLLPHASFNGRAELQWCFLSPALRPAAGEGLQAGAAGPHCGGRGALLQPVGVRDVNPPSVSFTVSFTVDLGFEFGLRCEHCTLGSFGSSVQHACSRCVQRVLSLASGMVQIVPQVNSSPITALQQRLSYRLQAPGHPPSAVSGHADPRSHRHRHAAGAQLGGGICAVASAASGAAANTAAVLWHPAPTRT